MYKCESCQQVFNWEFVKNTHYCPAIRHDANNNVNHPPHYQGKVECIDALEAATADLQGLEAVCTANAIKYLWRWKKKNGVEDLKKARWYLDKLLEKAGDQA